MIAGIYNPAKVGISHDKYTISEGNLDGEIFHLIYENNITICFRETENLMSKKSEINTATAVADAMCLFAPIFP